MRRLKRWLWTRIEAKVGRYNRCRQCSMLLRIADESGFDDPKVLSEHLGHHLEEVTYVNLWEWARIRAGL